MRLLVAWVAAMLLLGSCTVQAESEDATSLPDPGLPSAETCDLSRRHQTLWNQIVALIDVGIPMNDLRAEHGEEVQSIHDELNEVAIDARVLRDAGDPWAGIVYDDASEWRDSLKTLLDPRESGTVTLVFSGADEEFAGLAVRCGLGEPLRSWGGESSSSSASPRVEQPPSSGDQPRPIDWSEYEQGWEDGCHDAFYESPDGSGYWHGEEYTVDECIDGLDHYGDPEYYSGYDAGYEYAFDITPEGVMCWGEDCWSG